jgi:hypothetical protein
LTGKFGGGPSREIEDGDKSSNTFKTEELSIDGEAQLEPPVLD